MSSKQFIKIHFDLILRCNCKGKKEKKKKIFSFREQNIHIIMYIYNFSVTNCLHDLEFFAAEMTPNNFNLFTNNHTEAFFDYPYKQLISM